VIRRALALCLAGGSFALALAPGSLAHPLGNFTVNRYAGIEVAGNAVYVRYALDLAEIPTVQLGGEVRAPGYARILGRRLVLTLDGRRAPLVPLAHRTRARPGAGGLETLRFDAVYRARASGTRLRLVDRTFPRRIGWREITLSARDGARVLRSDAPARSTSDALHVYPADLLRSPLDVSTAAASIEPGSAPAPPPPLDGRAAAEHGGGGFESLVARGDLSLGVVALSLVVAAFWGAAHALTPGHGKALVAGYLIGTRGRPRDALLLGATVTVTHTAGVFGLGVVTLGLSQLVVPEQLYPWLTLVSGVLVVAVGAGVLRGRLRGVRPGVRPGVRLQSDTSHHHHHHDHHGHSHHHAGVRLKSDTEGTPSGGIIGAGVAAGLLPCPSALVVLLSAIALHRIGFGFALILAFSLGLAATITGIGLVAVLARRAFSRVSLDGPLVRALPPLSALVIVLVGVVLTARAIPAVV
jgi:ABC-type nickel/cobalt efflux system permease component RcnA